MEIFQSLPETVLRELESRLIEKKYNSKSPIYLTGDTAEYIWFVKDGHVKATVDLPNGRCQTLCLVGPGQMFGTCCCFGGGAHPCNATAETDVTAVRLAMKDFLTILEKYPKVSVAMVSQISKRLRNSKEAQTFDQESVERRMMRVLLELVKDFGRVIPLTRRSFAELAGTTVETSIRTFTHLESEGLVSTGRNRVTVLDPKVLASRLDA